MSEDINNKGSIHSCKVCGANSMRIPQDKTPSGYVGQKDDTGKWWAGRVCGKCLPTVRKTRYRKSKEYPEVDCKGCGVQFKPKRLNKSQTCSAKCTMRVKRSQGVKDHGKAETLSKVKLPGQK